MVIPGQHLEQRARASRGALPDCSFCQGGIPTPFDDSFPKPYAVDGIPIESV